MDQPGLIVTCESCRGSGIIYNPTLQMAFTCPACNGTGKLFVTSSLN